MNHPDYDFQIITRHLYDIDAFQILDALRDKYKSYNEKTPHDSRSMEFLDVEEDVLMEFLTEQGIDASFHQKRRNYIIPSNSNLFNSYLGYKILTIDLYKIERLLSYQSTLFLGNYYASKGNFTGLVEYLVYNFVKARLLPFEHERLEKIVNWLERNTTFEPYAEKSISSAPQGTTPIPKFRVKDGFVSILYEKFKYYFAEEERPLLFDLLKNGEIDGQICFHGNANQLAELFKRLRYNIRIEVKTLKDLTEWIIKHFRISTSSQDVQDLKFVTINQVLRKADKEAKKGKRILEEIVPFIVEGQRKQDPPN
jgi:hypothetical protein